MGLSKEASVAFVNVICQHGCKKDGAIEIDMLDTPYAQDSELKKTIYERGL